MKKATILTIFIFSNIFSTSAQGTYVSIDPFLPLFGTFQIHGEKAIHSKLSGMIGFGYKGSSGIFEINGIQTETMDLNDIDFEGYKIIPEVRWYWSKIDKGLTGFYTGAYYKFQKNSSEVTGVYTDKDGNAISVDLDMRLTSNSGGIEIGYKLKAWKGLFFDFLFAGVGVTSHRAVFTENTVLPETFYQRFNEAADHYSVLKDLEPKLNLTREDLDTKFILPNFRYGIKVGWAF
ncbi:MAG: hypothetical protein ACKOQ6_06785 [Bacteroidota bacterium]